MTASLLIHGATWAAAGLGFGLAYFRVLRRSVDHIAEGPLVPALLMAGRIVAAIVLFGIAAKAGAPSLLAAFLGFLMARALAVQAVQRGA